MHVRSYVRCRMMASWKQIITVLFMAAAVAVNGQTVFPSTSVPCVGAVKPTWNVTNNAHQLGGDAYPTAATLDECQAACVAIATCIAVDWDTNAGASSKCWLIDSSRARDVQGASNVNNYALFSRGSPGSCSSTCYAWSVTADTHALGGSSTSDTTIELCKASCIKSATCSGFDWDKANTNKCWLSPLNPSLAPATGVEHYTWTKTTGASCVGADGCILFRKGGGVLATGSDSSVVVTDDISQATVFLRRPCLANTIQGVAVNDCYSYEARDKEGFYIRSMCPMGLSLDQFNASVYADRFKQDSSFFVHSNTSGPNFFAIESTAYNALYITGQSPSGATTLNKNPSPDDSNFYCGAPLPAPTSRDTCPLVWRRIDGAIAVSSNVIILEDTHSDVCRQRCVVLPTCVGVSSDSEDCRLLLEPVGTEQSLQADSDFRHYDLVRQVPGTCGRGCLSSWTRDSLTAIAYANNVSAAATAYSCRLKCIDRKRCTGVIYNNTGCYLLYDESGSTTSVVGIGTSYLALTRELKRCSPCVNDFATVFNATDASATSQGAATNAQCRTICINNRMCVGYELRADGNCYISTSAVTLNMASSDQHSDIIRPDPYCGNDCVHGWLFYQHTSMVDSTDVVTRPATSERACREACIADAKCTAADWHAGTAVCKLGLAANVGVNYGTRGWNHFELDRDYLCY